jgi:hypothetical protein|tara:strand:+ start:554 stop:745 length:192 start_codon:yes stop_codon:yes gene_type:complete
MSKMGKLYLESEKEEIAFNNSQYDQEKTFLDYTIRDVLTFMAEITIGLFVVFVLWLFIILVLI